MKRTLSLEAWLAEGEKLFGKDRSKWRFVCPVCKNIQQVSEFEELGVARNLAFFNCIGRYKDGGKLFFSGLDM